MAQISRRKQSNLRVEGLESRELLSANSMLNIDSSVASAPGFEAAVVVSEIEVADAVESLTGDLNGDSTVDGNDFLAWQIGYSSGAMTGEDWLQWQIGMSDQPEASSVEAATTTGDLNGDGTVDGNDFLAWQIGYSSGAMTGEDWLQWQIGMSDQAQEDSATQTDTHATSRVPVLVSSEVTTSESLRHTATDRVFAELSGGFFRRC